MTPRRRALMLIALVLAIAIPASAIAATVTAPKSGSRYTSGNDDFNGVFDVLIQVRGRSVEIVAMDFPCVQDVSGRGSVNDFRLKRTDRGYRFNADANSIVTYSDEQQDENAKMHISGRFALNARTVRGHIRVRSKRCGDTNYLRWRARIRSSR